MISLKSIACEDPCLDRMCSEKVYVGLFSRKYKTPELRPRRTFVIAVIVVSVCAGLHTSAFVSK